MRKIARWENHERFNVRCSRYKITPICISMTTNITGVRAQHIVKKAELQLLGVRIRQRTYTIKKLNESLTTTGRHKDWIVRGCVILTPPSRGHGLPAAAMGSQPRPWAPSRGHGLPAAAMGSQLLACGHLFNVKWLNFSYQFLNIRLVFFVSYILYGTNNNS